MRNAGTLRMLEIHAKPTKTAELKAMLCRQYGMISTVVQMILCHFTIDFDRVLLPLVDILNIL